MARRPAPPQDGHVGRPPLIRLPPGARAHIAPGVAVAFALALTGCDACEPRDEHRDGTPHGPRVATEPKALGVDAALFDEPTDPPPPTGELAREIASFTTLGDCVERRAQFDPLLADAVRSLGYATFVRDACRMLEAMKTRDVAPCRSIDVSALRARCESLVAIVTGEPDRCPWVRPSDAAAGREPPCLAAASRLPALCAATHRLEQPTCEAVALGDPGPCVRHVRAGERQTCAREVARLLPVLPAKSGAKPPTPAALLRVDAAGGSGGEAQTFDATDDVRAGVVLEMRGSGARFSLGRSGEIDRRPRAGAAIARTGELRIRGVAPRGGGLVAIERLEIELPTGGTVVCAVGPCPVRVEAKPLELARGAAFVLTARGTLGNRSEPTGTARAVAVEATTFVRDVVQPAR